jgi:sensor histidine kinase YesM
MRLEFGIYTRIGLNLLFWAFYFIYPFLRFRYTGEHSITYEEIGFYFLVYGFVLYLNNLVLLPQYLKKHNLRKYLLILLPIMLSVAFFEAYVNKTLLQTCSCEGPNSTYALYNFIHLGILLVLFSAVPVLRNYSAKLKDLERAETDRLEAELKFLKAQVNPHLLFNSLNSIYSYALKKASETPEMVLKLSDLLRYMLYEADKHKVELQKEIEYLNDYIDLQKMRKDGFKVNFEIIGDIEHYSIAPMILINFVENAFKYIDPFQPEINLSLVAQNKTIFFSCENSFNKDSGKSHLLNEQGGLGLKNAKQLLHAFYGERYQLDIHKSDQSFNVKLLITNDEVYNH